MMNSLAAASSANPSTAVDVRRQGGWLPDSQEDLEAWLAGHRERAMVVLPLGAILDWTMSTPAGFAAFRDRPPSSPAGTAVSARQWPSPYAREGADVLISYLDEHDDARETARWVEQADRKAVLVPGDLADAAHCRAVIDTAVAEFGRVDILVSNAAQQMTHDKLEDITDDEWD